MTNLIKFDEQSIINNWIEQEKNGVEFPVDFDLAWQIIDYSTKGNAKRKLLSKKSYLVEGQDFIRSDEKSTRGRSKDSILLTCDGFKHFSLLAETEKGRLIRQYFSQLPTLTPSGTV